MRFVEVAGVSTSLTAFFRTCASQCTASHWQACHYGSRGFGRRCAPTLQLPWDYLVHPGIRFGRVVMCFVEVAGVSTRLTPSSCTASHSHACHSVARDLPELRVYCRGSPGSSAPGISFWRRCHAFGGSGRRE